MSDVDLTHLADGPRRLAEYALRVGWTARQVNTGAGYADVLLIAPHARKTIELSASVRQWNQRKLDSLARTVTTYGNKLDVERELGEAKPVSLTQRIEVPPEVAERVEAPRPKPGLVPPKGIDLTGVAERTIIETQQHKNIIERLWSDGATDYACPICGYASPATNVFGPHMKKHKAKPVDDGPVEPTVVVQGAAVESADAKLAAIRSLLDDGETDRLRAELDEARRTIAEWESKLRRLLDRAS